MNGKSADGTGSGKGALASAGTRPCYGQIKLGNPLAGENRNNERYIKIQIRYKKGRKRNPMHLQTHAKH
jgi:hypothetical protein